MALTGYATPSDMLEPVADKSNLPRRGEGAEESLAMPSAHGNLGVKKYCEQ